MLLGVQRHALATNILLRTKVGGVGVEHRFNIFSPNVAKIEQLRRPAKRRPKSKLYFIKTNPKIDVGDVDSQIRKEVHKLKMQNQAY
jgi:ribosomal protein L19